MPSKPNFTVAPQRSDGCGYVDCELHRATSFAVKKSWKTRGVTITRILSRHSTRTQAQGEADHRNRAAMPLSRAYKLGQRMGARP